LNLTLTSGERLWVLPSVPLARDRDGKRAWRCG
jgi:hypothetical protein